MPEAIQSLADTVIRDGEPVILTDEERAQIVDDTGEVSDLIASVKTLDPDDRRLFLRSLVSEMEADDWDTMLEKFAEVEQRDSLGDLAVKLTTLMNSLEEYDVLFVSGNSRDDVMLSVLPNERETTIQILQALVAGVRGGAPSQAAPPAPTARPNRAIRRASR